MIVVTAFILRAQTVGKYVKMKIEKLGQTLVRYAQKGQILMAVLLLAVNRIFVK